MKNLIKTIILTLLTTAFALSGLNTFSVFAETDTGNQHGYITVDEEFLPVYTLQKSGNDNENFNILFLGDGYTENEQTKMLSDISVRANTLLQTEPFRSYSDKINIYAVPTVSEESGVSDYYYITKNTYFSITVLGTITSFTGSGESKARKIKQSMEDNYMDKGATIGTIHMLSNSPEHFGSSNSALFSFASTDDLYAGGEASIHEIAHSIGRLKDEYGIAREGVNASTSNDPEVVQWKKFLGFRGIGIINNENSEIYFIPSRTCIMMKLDTGKFCEVCKFELATRLNSTFYTQSPNEYHLADPDITIEHSSTGTFGSNYEICRVNDNTITRANGHNVELRTIVQNFKNVDRNFKMVLEITDSNGERKFYKEEDFVIPALPSEYNIDDARKSISVTINNVSGLVIGDKISGQVIDTDKNEVIATDKTDKIPMSKITIHHKIKTPLGRIADMPKTLPTTIYVPKGTTYKPKDLLQLNGYTYIGNSLDNGETEITGETLEIDFYYQGTAETDIELPGTITTVSDDGKTFTVKAYNLKENNIIVLSLYNGDSLCEAGFFRYDGNDITFTAKEDYTYAEVMVWEDLTNIQPICDSETVGQIGDKGQ